MSEIREQVDVCVVGAGHAGCEAALARKAWIGNGDFYGKRRQYSAYAL